jgi:G3E family GTPase
MKVLIIGGFLGSGKTSVLLQLAKHIVAQEPKRDGTTVMIIENEIGDVGVDDKLLLSQGLAVKDLFAGCACCTSGGELLSDINTIMREVAPGDHGRGDGGATPGRSRNRLEPIFMRRWRSWRWPTRPGG